MADHKSAPARTRPELAARLDARTWGADDSAALWTLCASSPGAESLARDLPPLLTEFGDAVAEIVKKGADSRERVALQAMIHGDHDRARRHYIDMAASSGDRTLQTVLLFRQAVLFAPIDPAVSITALTRLVALAPDARGPLWMLGSLLERSGRLDDAAACFEQLLALEGGGGAPLEAARAAFALARTAAKQGDEPLRVRRYAEGVEYLVRGGAPPARLLASLENLATMYLGVGDQAGAWNAYRRGLELAMASEDVAKAGSALQGLWLLGTGSVAVSIDAPSERMLSHSIEWFAARGDATGGAHAALVLGGLAERRGRPEEAARFYERARALSEGHAQGQEVMVLACEALGTLRLRHSEYDEADRLFAAASAVCESLGLQGLSAGLIERRGDSLFSKGDRDAAREQWNRALARYGNTRDDDAARRLRQSMRAKLGF